MSYIRFSPSGGTVNVEKDGSTFNLPTSFNLFGLVATHTFYITLGGTTYNIHQYSVIININGVDRSFANKKAVVIVETLRDQVFTASSSGGSGVASAAEVNTGTDNTKYVSPLALKSSLYALSPAVFNAVNSGVSIDGITDQSANINNLLGNNRTIIFPVGTYALTAIVSITGYSNLKLIADPGAIFTTTLNKAIVLTGNCSNIEIAGFNITSTRNSATDDTEGLILLSNFGSSDVMDGINIHDNYFTNPLTKANGIKIISEGATSLVKNLFIRNNKFISIGRFGVELQNHNMSPARVRYQDYDVSNNFFYDIGTIQTGVAVSAISFSGWSENGTCNNNKIVDMRMNTTVNTYYGIENAGCLYMKISGNQMYSRNYGFTGITFTGNTAAQAISTGQPQITGCIVDSNLMRLTGGADNTKVRGIVGANLLASSITDNNIVSDGYGIYLQNYIGNTICGNILISKSVNVIYCDTGNTLNIIQNNYCDNQGASADNGVISFNGSTTTLNYCNNNSGKAFGGGQITIAQNSSAANNTSLFTSNEPLKLNNLSSDALIVGGFGDNAIKINASTISAVKFSTGAATNLNFTAPLSFFSAAGQFSTSLQVGSVLTIGALVMGYAQKATSYTIGANDNTIEVTATGQTITLPSAISLTGKEYTIILNATGSCTIATTSSQNINGSTTYSLSAQYKYVTVVSTNSMWLIKANN